MCVSVFVSLPCENYLWFLGQLSSVYHVETPAFESEISPSFPHSHDSSYSSQVTSLNESTGERRTSA